jgi:hypothetical protein
MAATRIETKTYYGEPLGATWTVRYKATGEVVCLRPDEKSATEAMELLEKRGTLRP